jgi:hypothetical protein
VGCCAAELIAEEVLLALPIVRCTSRPVHAGAPASAAALTVAPQAWPSGDDAAFADLKRCSSAGK